MARPPRWWLLALAGLALGALPGRAEVYVRTPFVTVVAGTPAGPVAPGVFVRVPGLVNVQVRKPQAAVLMPPPAPFVPLPAAPPAPEAVVPPPDGVPLPPPQPLAVRPLTHAEFARSFQPAAGTYEVVLVHPVTCCPVKVCFTLPPGCPKKVRVERRELEFDYGRHEVEIRFERRGGVHVEYR
jgi:hypothetical protein